jgi:hypothetical protein
MRASSRPRHKESLAEVDKIKKKSKRKQSEDRKEEIEVEGKRDVAFREKAKKKI